MQATTTSSIQSTVDLEYEFEIWLLQLTIRDTTINGYRPAFTSFNRFCRDELPTRELFISWTRQITATLSDLTVFSYTRTVRRFFTWCVRRGRYQDITVDVRLPGRNMKQFRRGSLSLDQVRKLLLHVKQNGDRWGRDLAMLHLLVSCGLRRIEVVRTNVGDLGRVRDRNCLRVQGKGHSTPDDFVLLSAAVFSTLNDYLNRRPGGRGAGTRPLFETIQGNRHVRPGPHTITYICRRWLRAAEIEGFRLSAHSLRHTAAVLALEGGAGLFEVSSMLRHSDIATTKLYLHSVNRLRDPAEDHIQLNLDF